MVEDGFEPIGLANRVFVGLGGMRCFRIIRFLGKGRGGSGIGVIFAGEEGEEGDEFGLAAGFEGGGEVDFEEVGVVVGEPAGVGVGEVVAVAELAKGEGAAGTGEVAGELFEEELVGLGAEVIDEGLLLGGEPAGEGDGGAGGFREERG